MKILQIEACHFCYHRIPYNNTYVCELSDNAQVGIVGGGFPSWCPLEDAPKNRFNGKSCNEIPSGNGYCDKCAKGLYEQCRYVKTKTQKILKITDIMSVSKAGVIAAGISDHLNATEQGFFVAGFQEAVKYLIKMQSLENVMPDNKKCFTCEGYHIRGMICKECENPGIASK